MGGLKKYMPYTYMTFLAGWLAICGIIPFSGFWSKDEILWNAASTTLHSPRLARLVGWNDRGDLHGVLHDASGGDDVLGQGEIPGPCITSTHRSTKCTTRITRRPSHHAHIPHESPPFDVGAARRAGCAGDDRWVCRYWSGFQSMAGSDIRRPAEHRQLPRSDHLESSDTRVRHTRMCGQLLANGRKALRHTLVATVLTAEPVHAETAASHTVTKDSIWRMRLKRWYTVIR